MQLCSSAFSFCVCKIIGVRGPCELSVLGGNLMWSAFLGMQNFPWVSKWCYIFEGFLPGGQGRWRLQAEKPSLCSCGHKVPPLKCASQRSDNSGQFFASLVVRRWVTWHCFALLVSVVTVFVSTVSNPVRQPHSFCINILGGNYQTVSNKLGTLMKRWLIIHWERIVCVFTCIHPQPCVTWYVFRLGWASWLLLCWALVGVSIKLQGKCRNGLQWSNLNPERIKPPRCSVVY